MVTSLAPETRRRMVIRAVVASAVGTTIEWYDFFLYGVAAAAVFPQKFFPESDPFVATLLGFSTYFVGFAARPIGGLCAKALRFQRRTAGSGTPADRPGESIGFEEFLLRHALGESMDEWQREPNASAVMMIPIPRSGVYREVRGLEAAAQVDGVDAVQITAKPDQQLLALPEGATYLGFIFARAWSADTAERAVRKAHARLQFTIDPLLPMKPDSPEPGVRL